MWIFDILFKDSKTESTRIWHLETMKTPICNEHWELIQWSQSDIKKWYKDNIGLLVTQYNLKYCFKVDKTTWQKYKIDLIKIYNKTQKDRF